MLFQLVASHFVPIFETVRWLDDKCEQMERIKSAGLEIYFDVIIVAGEIGIYKPNPAIFLSALNRINVSPEKALYIGDSLAYDVLGAKAAGLKTVLFNQNTKRNSTDANYCVHGINELQTLFDQIIL
jgi:putative hydrolase of the HAD superfamily